MLDFGLILRLINSAEYGVWSAEFGVLRISTHYALRTIFYPEPNTQYQKPKTNDQRLITKGNKK